MTKKITGRVVYLDFEGGFWGIDTGNEKFQPLKMPEQLKSQGVEIECEIKLLKDHLSMHNWGVLCEIVGFSTICKP